jgi:hypothetical protein
MAWGGGGVTGGKRTYRVNGDLRQSVAWLFAATALGLSVPRFLRRAGDVYARHLAFVKPQREDKANALQKPWL